MIKIISLNGLEPQSIAEFYQAQYNRWLFDNSDQVWIDGELIDKSEKLLIQMSFYNIKPAPVSIECDCKQNGFVLKEKDFRQRELSRYREMNLNKAELISYKRAEAYINYLEGEPQKSVNDLTSMQLAALHYYTRPTILTNSNVNQYLKDIGYTAKRKKLSKLVEDFVSWKSSERFNKLSHQSNYEAVLPFLQGEAFNTANQDLISLLENVKAEEKRKEEKKKSRSE